MMINGAIDLIGDFITIETVGALLLGAVPVWLAAALRNNRRKARLKDEVAREILAVQYDLYARANLQPWRSDDPRHEWMLQPLKREIDEILHRIRQERLSADAEGAALDYREAVAKFIAKWARTRTRRSGEGGFWEAYGATETAALRAVEALGRSRKFRDLIKRLRAEERPTDSDDQRPYHHDEADPSGPPRLPIA